MTASDPPQRLQCLITGGAGFIGAALARELARGAGRVTCLDDCSAGDPGRLAGLESVDFVRGDVGEAGVLAAVLHERGPFDVLFHLAARVGVRAVLRDPEACRRENLAGVRALIDALQNLSVEQRPRVLAASSSEVYDDGREPLGESAPLRTAEGCGRFAYAASKRRAEEMLEAAQLWASGRGPVHLRLFNVVGPGQSAEGGMVLPTFVEAARAGRPLSVHGDGRQVRTFAHVDEVARVLAELAHRADLSAGSLNVGGRARTTIGELAREVTRRCPEAAGIESVDPRVSLGPAFEEVPFRVPDLQRLAALGVSVPRMSLAEIVSDTLDRHPPASVAETVPTETVQAGSGRRACASPAS